MKAAYLPVLGPLPAVSDDGVLILKARRLLSGMPVRDFLTVEGKPHNAYRHDSGPGELLIEQPRKDAF